MVGQGKRPLKVFLCHASGDKPAVRQLYKHLVTEGLDAWLDQEKLLPGQDWRLEIPKAVREADVVVICLSNRSITKEGYVQKEIKFALDIAEEKPEGTIFVIPARLEDCPVPERLNRWQWVDLFEENGYVRLLRSLKIRAEKTGAVIEPLPYDDKEREKRLEQLYTEGLAAFWVEDWDKACYRFQTILSENPNHAGAAEKLEEAERQRNFAKLYSKAVEAQKNQEWQQVIGTLEDLLKKASAYKDANAMLKTARKEQQLKVLYAEAKTLHTAQKWEAVIKVFEQISSIETNYADPDNLLASAQREVAELQRIAILNELYSDAIHRMDAGQWYEARTLLEQVHKTETGFLETEKLLRKVEDEIRQHEEQQKRQDQINTLYEQAHGLLRSKKWRKALDKIEEIRTLDSQFEDSENIAEQAQKELEREEQEAERQNELAAMYAEAVRLLREEMYQEALEKLGDVKAIDPKYPDRQWVGRTAKKALVKQAKLVPAKPRFVIPKSLWIGLSVIAVTAITIFTVSTLINMYFDPTLIDDFDDLKYDGGYNHDKWELSLFRIDAKSAEESIKQMDGEMILLTRGNSTSLGLIPLNYSKFRLTNPTFCESRIKLDENSGDGYAVIRVWIFNETNYFGQMFCAFSYDDSGNHSFACHSGKHVGNNYVEIFDTALLEVDPKQWHTVRIEMYPEDLTFKSYIDDKLFYSKSNVSDFANAKFSCGFEVSVDISSGAPVIGYFDNFRVGAIEDDPNSK